MVIDAKFHQLVFAPIAVRLLRWLRRKTARRRKAVQAPSSPQESG